MFSQVSVSQSVHRRVLTSPPGCLYVWWVGTHAPGNGYSLDLGYYGIWLTSGRYESYLSAFLFVDKFRNLLYKSCQTFVLT